MNNDDPSVHIKNLLSEIAHIEKQLKKKLPNEQLSRLNLMKRQMDEILRYFTSGASKEAPPLDGSAALLRYAAQEVKERKRKSILLFGVGFLVVVFLLVGFYQFYGNLSKNYTGFSRINSLESEVRELKDNEKTLINLHKQLIQELKNATEKWNADEEKHAVH